jgi:hypothetical protein
MQEGPEHSSCSGLFLFGDTFVQPALVPVEKSREAFGDKSAIVRLQVAPNLSDALTVHYQKRSQGAAPVVKHAWYAEDHLGPGRHRASLPARSGKASRSCSSLFATRLICAVNSLSDVSASVYCLKKRPGRSSRSGPSWSVGGAPTRGSACGPGGPPHCYCFLTGIAVTAPPRPPPSCTV